MPVYFNPFDDAPTDQEQEVVINQKYPRKLEIWNKGKWLRRLSNFHLYEIMKIIIPVNLFIDKQTNFIKTIKKFRQ